MAAAGAVLLVLLAPPGVRIERDAVRVGGELISGSSLQLRGVGRVPVRVSRDVVENLSRKGRSVEVAIAAGDRRVTLGPGVRITRAREGWSLSARGKALRLRAGEADLDSAGDVRIRFGERGVRAEGLGRLEGPSLSVEILPEPE